MKSRHTPSADIRAIAFYLPQFHPIPENDEWWGKGFTEWRNVTKANPVFPEHYQPHLPADLGFYDLRLPEVREAQAELARQYGIHGFCYYHYWFNGRRILERPFNEVLQSGKPDFPFCLCWANENWTRVWDGGERNVLLSQIYSSEDDLAHIRSLISAFKDPRYIRIDGKPLFLVYRTESLPNPFKSAQIWREEAARAGIGDLYLVRVAGFDDTVDPREIGFDAAVEFAPDWRKSVDSVHRDPISRLLINFGIGSKGYLNHFVTRYDGLIRRMQDKPMPDYIFFRCVTPGFDNSSRRSRGAAILIGNTPERYGSWLADVVQQTRRHYIGDHRLVFINAWNEWAEGNHLEPDLRNGLSFLEATRQALDSTYSVGNKLEHSSGQPAVNAVQIFYWKIVSLLRRMHQLFRRNK
ncbi:MAG: polysaccharide biosynthesis protein [bacterium]|nr:MAG: polysaccharide biosynthesis protein [bacterium]KAF0149819.1 MAG: polysaccharide biosynthesis protein [bacterium]KAF0168520.1 MAG: polysaccharide biosynthesis protein [bacterium]TXT19546.1 MAG: polysaccharide biosynthesis protein [bacterium]